MMTSDQVRELAEMLGAQLGGWRLQLATVVITLVAAGIGAYLGAFLSEKGKNRAIREDLDKIVYQMQRTTQAAEDVKAAIANVLWLKQKRWDLRRDVYTQLLEALETLEQSTHIMTGADKATKACAEIQDAVGAAFHRNRYDIARERAVEALRNARRARALGGVFLSPEARQIVEELGSTWNTALETSSQGAVGAYPDLSKIIGRAQSALTNAARIELMEKAE